MSKSSENVKQWRKNTKRKLILVLGGKCIICGYDKCDNALEFHHANPLEKEISWGNLRANIKSLRTILNEMKKCVLLCSNCHKEIHNIESDTSLPNIVKFINNEDIENILNETHTSFSRDKCPVCESYKFEWFETCSVQCYNKLDKKIDWNAINLLELHEEMSVTEIAYKLKCNGKTVMRRLQKLLPQYIIDEYKNKRMLRKNKIVSDLDKK